MSRIDDFLSKGKLKKFKVSNEMVIKELEVGKRDFETAKESFKLKSYKWATIQAYYAIFHVVRALLFKAGYREESHYALKIAVKELYFDTNLLDKEIYKIFEMGMELREFADYKDSFSENGAQNLIVNVENSISKVEEYFKREKDL